MSFVRGKPCLLPLLIAACASSPSQGGGTTGASRSDAGTGTTTTRVDGGSGSSTTPLADDDGLLPTTSVWRSTNEWYRNVDSAPVVEHSAEMIGEMQMWGKTGAFQIDYAFDVLDATGGTPVHFPTGDESDDVLVPIPAQGSIEGDHAYDACPDGADCHLLVVDRAALKLYEVYGAHRNGTTWTGAVSLWQLDKTYPRANRGQGCTSADAAGLAITPGLIGYRETKHGTIAHALRFTFPNARIRGVLNQSSPNVAYPASHGTKATASSNGPPYGARLRLKIDANDPRVKSPGGRAVVDALHHYGMILADGGDIPLLAESVKSTHDTDATATWDGLLESHDIDFLTPADFEVLAIPKDHPGGAAGWYASRADYEGQLHEPLGCNGIVQP